MAKFWKPVPSLVPSPPENLAPKSAPSILDSYFTTLPSDQNAIDIFKGEWASKFPPPFDHLKAGDIPVFQDSRLEWGIHQMGGVYDRHVLELGPLEGAHSYMLERAGAKQVTAIEANSRAFLKCLITKQIVGLARTAFEIGDFVTYMENCKTQFGAIIASGVLYHMKDPLHLLELIARRTDRAYFWTHYYDERIIGSKPHLRLRFQTVDNVKIGSVDLSAYRQQYQDSLAVNGFCGGSADHSTWLSRDGILVALRELGFNSFHVGYEMPDHPHGPCFCLVVKR